MRITGQEKFSGKEASRMISVRTSEATIVSLADTIDSVTVPYSTPICRFRTPDLEPIIRALHSNERMRHESPV